MHANSHLPATHGRVPMADTWLTIEQAAVTLGLSVRTVNRHIHAGKIQSRLHDGRREVLVRIPDDAADEPADAEADDGAGATATSSASSSRATASSARSGGSGSQQSRFDDPADTSDYRDGNGHRESSS